MKLADFMVSKVRVRLLKVLFSAPGRIYYVRELVRLIGEEINAVRRELGRMEKAGMVYKEKRGNRLYYGLRKEYGFYQDLLAMVAKVSGLGGAIIANKRRLGRIKYAMLTGRFVRRLPRGKSDVDLLVVGNIVMPVLNSLVKDEEVRLEQEINYTVMPSDEFEFRKKRGDPFIVGILSGSRVMLIGDEEGMLKL